MNHLTSTESLVTDAENRLLTSVDHRHYYVVRPLFPHVITRHQSINQNLYSAPSRFLLRGAPAPGHAKKNSLEKVVKLRTGTVWEVPYLNWKAIPGCWTNHRKRTGLHCHRAGEWDHQILVCDPACMTFLCHIRTTITL